MTSRWVPAVRQCNLLPQDSVASIVALRKLDSVGPDVELGEGWDSLKAGAGRAWMPVAPMSICHWELQHLSMWPVWASSQDRQVPKKNDPRVRKVGKQCRRFSLV